MDKSSRMVLECDLDDIRSLYVGIAIVRVRRGPSVSRTKDSQRKAKSGQ